MEKSIIVTGEGRYKVAPDTTNIKLSFERVTAEYNDCIVASALDIKAVKDFLKELGLDEKGLKTTYFNIRTNYQYEYDKNNNSRSIPNGFKYEQTLVFSFPIDNKILGKILTLFVGSQLDAEFGIYYTLKNKDEAKRIVLEKAVEDATFKANVLTNSAGVKLGEIINIDHDDIRFNDGNQRRELLRCANTEACSVEDVEIDIEPEDIIFTDSVNIIWEIK